MRRREFIAGIGATTVWPLSNETGRFYWFSRRSGIAGGGGNGMRLLYVICFLAAAVMTSVAAADNGPKLKQEIESINAAYASNFNNQDAAGVAAVFTRDGIYISSAGARTDIANIYQNVWKTGFNHLENTVDQVWNLSNDVVLSSGEYRTLSGP